MEWLDYCKTLKSKVMNFYKKYQHRTFDLENPKTFTEKLQWLKIYDSTFEKAFCADKISVRDFCINEIGKDICIPILKTYNNPDEIKLNELPNQFVLKCNHGSGMNIVVKDKNNLNLREAKIKLSNWMKEDYSLIGGEAHYKLISRKIFAEKYIPNLEDVKFFCFNGNVKFIQIDKHFAEHRMNYYDCEWKPLKWLNRKCYPANYNILDTKPKNLDKMVYIANSLSKKFKFVRVDLYDINDEIYLGEMTFTPASGTQQLDYNVDLKIGEMLDLQ